MRKSIKKAKKVGDVAVKHKKPISIVTIFVTIMLIWYFWNDIIFLLKEFWEHFKEDWYKVPILFALYKLFLLSVVNLAKRFAINKGMERFKKTIIYSEMDELFVISLSIMWKKVKKNKLMERFLNSFVFRWISILSSGISFLYISIKTGLATTMVANLFSAQFWTLILTWIMNIPGFMTILGLAIWLWLETHIPWIPRFYNYLYSVTKHYLGRYWIYLEKAGDYLIEDLYQFEMKYFHPLGVYIDSKEVKFIKYLKRYVYRSSGKRNYKRYMRIVLNHNAKQIANKLERERVARVFRFGLLRRRVQMLKEYNKKMIKK